VRVLIEGSVSTIPEPHPLTYEAYLRLEEETGLRHEFLDGRVWAMSGGSPRHSAIKVNLVAFLRTALRGSPCRPYDSDLKVRVLGSGLATYADATVICGAIVRDPDDPNAAINPSVAVEVISRSTEAWDRGWKWEHYRSVDSLRHYLLVDQLVARVEHYERLEDGSWRYSVHQRGDRIELAAIGVELPVDVLYEELPDV
jgi:Uma2 family endonuclease